MRRSADALARPAEPSAHAAVVRFVLAGLRRLGGDCGALTRRAGLPPASVLADNSARVPTVQLGRLWQLGIAETGDPCLGVRVASQWRFGRFHLTDYLFGTAPTLADAIAGLVRFSPLLNTAANDVGLTWQESGCATVTWQVCSGDPAVDAAASQFALGSVLFAARHVLGREIKPVHLGLSCAAPPCHRELADSFGPRGIDFGVACSTMTVSEADLALPLPNADARLAAILQEHAAEVIAALTAVPRCADQLRKVIAGHLADDGLSLPMAARQLALSPRTLQRRLESEGTCWRETVDAVRRDRAALLLAGGLSRRAVAARLGYHDARALRGALRRWDTGSGG
jgi:AraC-like DNA-binding protein